MLHQKQFYVKIVLFTDNENIFDLVYTFSSQILVVFLLKKINVR